MDLHKNISIGQDLDFHLSVKSMKLKIFAWLGEGLVNFLCKRSDNKCFWLCGPYGLHSNYLNNCYYSVKVAMDNM